MSVLELPGFRFHPTEEELLNFYLRRIATGKKLHFDFIGLLYIYHHEPWELPGLAKIEGREWYFFVPRDKRHGHGGRPNRTTKNGFWKATGSDRQIRCLTEPTSVLGIKKTLVFYQGRAPRGCKTDWIMNEYRLPDSFPSPKEDIVLCKIYRKATSVKVLEQRASMENQVRITHLPPSSPLSEDTLTYYDHPQENFRTPMPLQDLTVKIEEEENNKQNYYSL
ncbi:unnamed protein product [Ilex paraguariensis]|uniref:NAC domain-containing protein n=1 Tax=Ilex paraguariensis TaxID=185542 RepID=A0ABC8RX63_9AQUA